jgi:hypothetical protein
MINKDRVCTSGVELSPGLVSDRYIREHLTRFKGEVPNFYELAIARVLTF